MDKNIITDKLLENKYQISCFGKGYYEGCYIGGYRYLLEITINTSLNNKKTLACIMMNPSTTFPNEKWESKNCLM